LAQQLFMMITFIKTLPYQLKPKGRDVFEHLSDLGLQKIDPPTLSENPLSITADVIFYSPLKRVADTIKNRTRAIKKESLREIVFDMKAMCSKEEYQEYKSVIVRKRFKEFFIKDKLPVKREVIFNEIEALLKESRFSGKKDIAVVSHSFRLKIIEAFIKTKGEVRHKPELIHKYIFDNEKTYPFGGGFSIDSKELDFL